MGTSYIHMYCPHCCSHIQCFEKRTKAIVFTMHTLGLALHMPARPLFLNKIYSKPKFLCKFRWPIRKQMVVGMVCLFGCYANC